MSERPADPTERTGPIERVETTHSDPAGTTRVKHVTYGSDRGPTGVLEEERRNRGVLYGVIGGVAAILLVGILWFAFLGPGRANGGNSQTNVNVAGGGSQQQPAQDLQLNIRLTQQVVLTTRPATAAPTQRPQPTSPPAAAPRAEQPTAEAPAQAPAAQQQPAAAPTQPSGPIATGGAPPSGWQTAATQNRSCQFAAPADWQINNTSARAPGDRATAALTSQPMSSWSAFKDTAKASQAGATAREDSDTRLWLERPEASGSAQHYIARPAGNVACVLQIAVTRDGVGALESTIRQIADTLGAPRG